MEITKDVCVVGAGPAGMLLTKLLLDKGYSVALLDKQKSFDAEFRGEFIQPGVVDILKNLNLFGEIAPFSITVKNYKIIDNGKSVFDYDFEGKYGICIRQSKILPLMLNECQKFDKFDYFAGQKAVSLLQLKETTTGISSTGENGSVTVNAKLTVGADGRSSSINKLMGVKFNRRKFLVDILWLKIPKPSNLGENIEIRIHENGYIVLLPSYPNQIRLGISIVKGGMPNLRKKYPEVSEFIEELKEVIPEAFQEIMESVKGWNSFTPLSVSGRLAEQWAGNGIILIGDAAHTVGPFAGQGINQAMEDAIELAKIIEEHGVSGSIDQNVLDNLRQIRYPEVAAIHEFQIKQEKLLGARGLFGRIGRKVIYSQIMKSRSKPNGMISKLTFRNLKL